MGYRAINFSAGPSTLPEEVLKKAAAEMLNYEGTGESVMEMSHRSAEFQKIIDDAEQNLRDLMNIPDDYYVLFLQGGGTLQFSMVPINLLTNSKKADYIITGNWAKKAYEEAQKFGDIRALASSADKNFSYIPKFKKEDIREDVDYVYVCYNNTIYGTHYNEERCSGRCNNRYRSEGSGRTCTGEHSDLSGLCNSCKEGFHVQHPSLLFNLHGRRSIQVSEAHRRS